MADDGGLHEARHCRPIAEVAGAARNGFTGPATKRWRETGGWTAHVALACGHRQVIVTSRASLDAIRAAHAGRPATG